MLISCGTYCHIQTGVKNTIKQYAQSVSAASSDFRGSERGRILVHLGIEPNKTMI